MTFLFALVALLIAVGLVSTVLYVVAMVLAREAHRQRPAPSHWCAWDCPCHGTRTDLRS